MPANLTLVSSFSARWFAAAVVLVAALGRKHTAAALSAAGLSGVGGLYLAAWEGHRLTQGANWSDWALVVGGLAVAALSALQLLTAARGRGVHDPLLLTAVQLYIGVAALWCFYAINGAALDYRNYAPATTVAFLRSSLPLVAIALGAVGLGLTRNAPAALERLGLVAPKWWHVALALFCSQLFLLAAHPINVVTRELTPDQYRSIALVSFYSYAAMPWWIYLAFAIIAGVSEETLFRGAVQPRIGIVATAVLFALAHTQYGLTPILAGVFVHGLVYGLLRRYLNTTTSIITHAGYDFGAYMGFGPIAYFGIAAVMVAALIIPAMRNRRAIYTVLGDGLRNDFAGAVHRRRLNPD